MTATAEQLWRSGLPLAVAALIYAAAELVAWARRQR